MLGVVVYIADLITRKATMAEVSEWASENHACAVVELISNTVFCRSSASTSSSWASCGSFSSTVTSDVTSVSCARSAPVLRTAFGWLSPSLLNRRMRTGKKISSVTITNTARPITPVILTRKDPDLLPRRKKWTWAQRTPDHTLQFPHHLDDLVTLPGFGRTGVTLSVKVDTQGASTSKSEQQVRERERVPVSLQFSRQSRLHPPDFLSWLMLDWFDWTLSCYRVLLRPFDPLRITPLSTNNIFHDGGSKSLRSMCQRHQPHSRSSLPRLLLPSSLRHFQVF